MKWLENNNILQKLQKTERKERKMNRDQGRRLERERQGNKDWEREREERGKDGKAK